MFGKQKIMLYICRIKLKITMETKTIECAFDDFFFNLKKNHDVVDYLLNKKSFESGVEYAQRWISVEDELPSGYVTLKCEGSQTYVSIDFSGANDVDTQWLAIEYCKATHWRPIELK